MYVIRPQFFMPIITLLVNASKKSIEYKKELAIAKSQSVDITNFENKLIEFKDKFGRNYRLASEKFQAAIDQIDKSIAALQKPSGSLPLRNDTVSIMIVPKVGPSLVSPWTADPGGFILSPYVD